MKITGCVRYTQKIVTITSRDRDKHFGGIEPIVPGRGIEKASASILFTLS